MLKEKIQAEYERMAPYLDRLKGRKLMISKIDKIEDEEILQKIYIWIEGIQQTTEWKQYIQICRELPHDMYMKYRVLGYYDYPEFKAFLKKRYTFREIYNATVPREITKAKTTTTGQSETEGEA